MHIIYSQDMSEERKLALRLLAFFLRRCLGEEEEIIEVMGKFDLHNISTTILTNSRSKHHVWAMPVDSVYRCKGTLRNQSALWSKKFKCEIHGTATEGPVTEMVRMFIRAFTKHLQQFEAEQPEYVVKWPMVMTVLANAPAFIAWAKSTDDAISQYKRSFTNVTVDPEDVLRKTFQYGTQAIDSLLGISVY